jgi:hypothetical protein
MKAKTQHSGSGFERRVSFEPHAGHRRKFGSDTAGVATFCMVFGQVFGLV